MIEIAIVKWTSAGILLIHGVFAWIVYRGISIRRQLQQVTIVQAIQFPEKLCWQNLQKRSANFFALQPFQSHVRHFSCRALETYNSPGDWARELFKPSTDLASLVVKIEKKFFVLVLSFSGGNVTNRGVFALFCPSLPGHGRRPNGPFLDSKFSWNLGKNPRL